LEGGIQKGEKKGDIQLKGFFSHRMSSPRDGSGITKKKKKPKKKKKKTKQKNYWDSKYGSAQEAAQTSLVKVESQDLSGGETLLKAYEQ